MGRPRANTALVQQAVELFNKGEHIDDIVRLTKLSARTVYRAVQGGPGTVAQPVPPVSQAVPEHASTQAPTATPVSPPAAAFLEDLAARPPPVLPVPIDADADPLTIMRALLKHATKTMTELDSNSPRLTQVRADARALATRIQMMEKELASKETPDEVTRRLRKEDGETRRTIERYVLAAERKAEAAGVCIHCGQKVSK